MAYAQTMPGTPFPALDELARLLEEQAEALLHGHADLLPALARELHRRLTNLQTLAAHMAWTPEARERLATLRVRAHANQVMAARRQVDVQKSLDALGAHAPRLQNAQAQQVYGNAGGMGLGGVRGQALGRA